MEYKKLIAPSLTDLFVEEMKKSIFNGSLKPGERLSSERQLADAFGVSLSVVHNGITRLCNVGLLKAEPRKGIRVADYVREGNIQTIYEVLDYTGGKLNKEIMVPIFECRKGTEIASTRAAAENRTDEDIVAISSILDSMRNDHDISAYAEKAFAFHHECAMASKNIYYPMLIRSFHPLYISFFKQYTNRSFIDKEIELYSEILESIIQQDASRAAELAEKDITIWEELVNL